MHRNAHALWRSGEDDASLQSGVSGIVLVMGYHNMLQVAILGRYHKKR